MPAITPTSLPVQRQGLILSPGAASAADDAGLKRDLRFGWIVILLFFGAFLGWAAFARLDSAAYAQGQITVAGHRQTIQHRDGGKVASVLVKEGEHVQAGQLLLTLDPGPNQALERAAASEVIGLEAERSRLIAERAGLGELVRPAEFEQLSPDEKAEADQAMRVQALELRTRRGSVASQKDVLAQRARQLSEHIAGVTHQVTETEVQDKLLSDQVANTQTLVDQGYASTNRLKSLQMQASTLRSQKADLSANAAGAQAQIAESRMQALSIDAQHAEDVAKDMKQVENQLNAALPKWLELKRQLDATQIRATEAGKVLSLAVTGIGGVINPGQTVLEIVPDAAPMVIEAQVSPNDADDLHVGQETEIKITAFSERSLPILKGAITGLSADSLVDPKTGARYFTAEVTVPVGEINKLMDERGKKEALRPGLPVQVLVPLKKRTALQYMFEPITQALWRAGREH